MITDDPVLSSNDSVSDHVSLKTFFFYHYGYNGGPIAYSDIFQTTFG